MSDEHAWVFFSKGKKKYLEKNSQACPMNMLGNQNHVVFFFMGEKKCPRMFIAHVWNIFSGCFFFKKQKKKPRMSQDSQDIHGIF